MASRALDRIRRSLHERVVERQRRYGWRFAPVFVWGWFLAALTAIQLALGFWWGWESYTLLGTSALWFLVLGAWLFFARGPDPEREVRSIPDESWGAVAAAAGASVALMGLVFGLWLALPGLGLFVAGLGMVGNELVAQRRAP